MIRNILSRHWRATYSIGIAILVVAVIAWWGLSDNTKNSSISTKLPEHAEALGNPSFDTLPGPTRGASSASPEEQPTDWINHLVKEAPITFSDYDGTNGIITVDREKLADLAVGDTVQMVFGEHKLHYIAGARRDDDEHGVYIGLGAVDIEQSIDKGFYSAYYLYPDGSGRIFVNSEVADFDAEFGADGDQAPFVNRLALREQYLKEHGALPPID